ncbi:MAG: hypothetical protein GF320_20435 [Armatimonadia bacterium]|nr:hypothetical protein [Armatimonadia bacterium]
MGSTMLRETRYDHSRAGHICMLLAAVVLLAGCASTPGLGPEGDGGLAVSVVWPEVTAELIPSGTQSIPVEVTDAADGSPVGSLLLTQTEPSGSLTGILAGTEVTVAATARPNADGTGTPLAAATTQATIPSGDTASVSLALASTIAEVVVTPSAPSLDVFEQVALSAEAMDGTSNTLLVPSGFQWTSDNGAMASVDSSGQVTAHAPGTAVITATEPESGASGQATVTVALGSISLVQSLRVGEPGYSHIAAAFEMAASEDDEVYILDSNADSVKIFSAVGEPIDRVPLPSGGHRDVEIGPDGLIWVLTNDLAAAVGLDRDGNTVKEIGPSADPDSFFSLPAAIGFDAVDRLHVVDQGDDRIKMFLLDGSFVKAYGGSGAALGEFGTPEDIVSGPGNKLFIADGAPNNRIQRFSMDGDPEAEFDAFGGYGALGQPNDITASPDQVVIADRGNDEYFGLNSALTWQWTTFGAPSAVAATPDGDWVFALRSGQVSATRFPAFLQTDWGTSPGAPGHFEKARDVAVDDQGRVYVLDGRQSRLSRFGPSGALEASVVPDHVATNEAPEALAMGPDGTLYVGFETAVSAYSPDLELLDSWESGDIGKIAGMVVGPDGNLYIADLALDDIRIFQPNGTFESSFGGANLNIPIDLDFDTRGNLFVVTDVGKIAFFQSDLTFLREWGQGIGSDPLQIDGPGGLAVDPRGLIYISDERNRRITVFQSTGDIVAQLPFRDEFSPLEPTNLALSSDGSRLYVCGLEDVLGYDLNN